MAVEIVRRNPIAPAKAEKRLDPIAVDDFGALYAVRTKDRTATFELILGGVARTE